MRESHSFIPATVAEYCGWSVNFAELLDLDKGAVSRALRAAKLELRLCAERRQAQNDSGGDQVKSRESSQSRRTLFVSLAPHRQPLSPRRRKRREGRSGHPSIPLTPFSSSAIQAGCTS